MEKEKITLESGKEMLASYNLRSDFISFLNGKKEILLLKTIIGARLYLLFFVLIKSGKYRWRSGTCFNEDLTSREVRPDEYEGIMKNR